MRADLGIAPSDDRDGCLQDPVTSAVNSRSYAIGNILSAQFYGAALKAPPGIMHEVTKGDFGTLHTWLRDNLYRHGSKFAPSDVVERATGAAMQMIPYLHYLHGRYGSLYRLPPGDQSSSQLDFRHDVRVVPKRTFGAASETSAPESKR